MTRMITDPDEGSQRRNIARWELFLEGTRRPELRPALNEIQSAAVKSASLILEAGGFTPSTEQMGELSRLLNGLAFSNADVRARAARRRRIRPVSWTGPAEPFLG